MKRTELARGPIRLSRRTPLARRLPRPTGQARQPRQAAAKPRKDTGPTKDTREIVHARSGRKCEAAIPGVCLGDATNIQHRLPRRMGGTSNPAVNTAAALLDFCGTPLTGCHGWAESHRTEALAKGWLLHAGADPACEPVVVRGRLCWLTEDGRKVDAGAVA